MNNFKQARRCVLYARLSVTKEESVSIARQLQSGRKYAEARGWEVVGEFVDDGVGDAGDRLHQLFHSPKTAAGKMPAAVFQTSPSCVVQHFY